MAVRAVAIGGVVVRSDELKLVGHEDVGVQGVGIVVNPQRPEKFQRKRYLP